MEISGLLEWLKFFCAAFGYFNLSNGTKSGQTKKNGNHMFAATVNSSTNSTLTLNVLYVPTGVDNEFVATGCLMNFATHLLSLYITEGEEVL